jgi:hypothetical protein
MVAINTEVRNMETPRLEQRLVIRPAEVMTNFCWAYTNALLQKLVELDEKDEIFVNGGNKALHMETDSNTIYSSEVTGIARVVMFELTEQIKCQGVDCHTTTPSQVTKLMSVCREFLDIFKKKEVVVEEPNRETVGRCIQRISNVTKTCQHLSNLTAATEIVTVLQKEFGFVPKEVSNT